ncbi:protein of unknown function [Paraburkholderia dioscoreae]|uniref:Uncharacterized protein n=1 Tax=Paraburkholderia dioscoreae TaxID=2604047 RepID=A0A5Q4YUH8_9BURK|nr:protein of unknown function [Paraburkholderia dioscoreae]
MPRCNAAYPLGRDSRHSIALNYVFTQSLCRLSDVGVILAEMNSLEFFEFFFSLLLITPSIGEPT